MEPLLLWGLLNALLVKIAPVVLRDMRVPSSKLPIGCLRLQRRRRRAAAATATVAAVFWDAAT